MGDLSTLQMVAFTFSPMVLTIVLVALVAWFSRRNGLDRADGPERLLTAAIRHMPSDRSEWGEAMMAELIHLHEHGQAFRWCFALGCVRAALFPPVKNAWLLHWLTTIKRFGSFCGILAVALPTLALPLLWLTAAACNAFMTHDNFSSGELIPTLLGGAILLCLATMFSGIPLGIAGLLRRERHRWLSCLGPAQSIAIFGYMQAVQYLANNSAPSISGGARSAHSDFRGEPASARGLRRQIHHPGKSNQSNNPPKSISGHSSHDDPRSSHENVPPPARSVSTSARIAA